MLRHLGSRQLNSHPCSASSWLDHMARKLCGKHTAPPLASSSPSLSPSFPSVQWAAQDTSSSGGPFLFSEVLQAWLTAAAGPGCQTRVLACSSLSPPSILQLWGWQLGPFPGAALLISFTPDGPWGFPREPLMGKLRPHFMMGKRVGLGPLSRQDSMVLQNEKQIPQPTKMCPLPRRAPGPSSTLWWGWGGRGRRKPASHICG